MPPFVKWLGGKSQMVDVLAKTIPADFEAYVEPMVGGGALFWHLAENGRLADKQVILNDTNEWLMHSYQAVRDDVEPLIKALAVLQEEYERRPELLYYEIRKRWNQGERSAAAFIFLKQTSYNGLWRVNRSGDLNMPWGHYIAPRICHSQRLRACAAQLKNVALNHGDYSAALQELAPKSVVYMDPPYFGTFDQYNKAPFWSMEHVGLIQQCAELGRAGAHVIYTHVDCPQALQWIREYWPGAHIDRANVRRHVSCKAAGRKAVSDLIVTHKQRHSLEVAS